MKYKFEYGWILFLMVIPIVFTAQCNLARVQSTSYLTGDCGGLIFQGTVGSLNQAYGDCGGLFFTPPLTGDDIISSTEEDKSNEISIFPNPAMDYILIQNIGNSSIQKIEIIHSTGQILITKNQVQGEQKIDISPLLSGLYFIKISIQDHPLIIKKFIKI